MPLWIQGQEYMDKGSSPKDPWNLIVWSCFCFVFVCFFWWEQQRKVINYIFLSFPDSTFLDLLLPIFWSHLWLRHYTLRVGRAKIQDSILNIFLFWVILVKTNIWYEKRLKLQLKWRICQGAFVTLHVHKWQTISYIPHQRTGETEILEHFQELESWQ